MAELRSLPPRAAEVHLVRLHSPAEADLAVLDRDESARYRAYRNRRHAAEFAAARAAVRRIIAGYTGSEPAVVPLRSQPNEKPYLEDGSIELSLAHRAGVAVVAIATRPIGVDVESGRSVADTSAVYATALNDAEQARFAEVTPEQRHHDVLRIWVRKEALLKRHGAGLRQPPAHLEVPGETRVDGAMVDVAGAPSRLWDLTLRGGLVGAVATAPTVDEIVVLDRLDEG